MVLHDVLRDEQDAFESEDQLVLVLEYAHGVELFDAILAKQRFSEAEARPIFVQVMLEPMHIRSNQSSDCCCERLFSP